MSAPILTGRKGQLHLLLDDLQGNEVVFLVESTVVEEESVPLPRGKPGQNGKGDVLLLCGEKSQSYDPFLINTFHLEIFK